MDANLKVEQINIGGIEFVVASMDAWVGGNDLAGMVALDLQDAGYNDVVRIDGGGSKHAEPRSAFLFAAHRPNDAYRLDQVTGLIGPIVSRRIDKFRRDDVKFQFDCHADEVSADAMLHAATTIIKVATIDDVAEGRPAMRTHIVHFAGTDVAGFEAAEYRIETHSYGALVAMTIISSVAVERPSWEAADWRTINEVPTLEAAESEFARHVSAYHNADAIQSAERLWMD